MAAKQLKVWFHTCTIMDGRTMQDIRGSLQTWDKVKYTNSTALITLANINRAVKLIESVFSLISSESVMA